MPDWTKSMQQTFEYYTVDPVTWKDKAKLDLVKTSTISWDDDADTKGSASIDVTDSVGEAYIRIYLITIQNGETEKHPLGTFLVQTPSSTYTGKSRSVTMDAYTPLIELKENKPPIGYYVAKDENIMETVGLLTDEYSRAPVVVPTCDKTVYKDFVANSDDTWLTYLVDLAANAKYEYALDDMGRIIFPTIQDTPSLQPVYTYTDDNSSILYPEATLEHDLFDIPNVVEVIYSDSGEYYYATAVNNDENSPTSTVNRGRFITYRVTNPELPGIPTEEQIQEYAETILREKSTVAYTITYTHGYCGTTLGQCVRLNYSRAGLTDIKAKIVSQTIKCVPGCPVTEKARFTTKLWEG